MFNTRECIYWHNAILCRGKNSLESTLGYWDGLYKLFEISSSLVLDFQYLENGLNFAFDDDFSILLE